MTYLELCQALRREVGASGTGPANVEGQTGEYARIVNWIANEWLRIQERHQRWNFAWAQGFIEIEPDFREYDMPSDVAAVDEDAIYRGDTKLKVIHWQQFREEFREPSNVDVRRIAFSPDGKLQAESFPKRTEQVSFEHWRKPQRLESNIDTPRCPAEYHSAIIYSAMMQYGLYENAPEVVEQARFNFDKVYQEMVNRELPGVGIQGPLA